MSDLAAAKAQLAFAELTGGVRFSGRKHGRDMAVFNRGKKSQQSGVGGGGAVGTGDDDDARVRAAGASGSGRAREPSTKPKSKRSKNSKASDGKDAADWNELGGGQDTSSDGEGDIDVFGGSASKKSDDVTGEKGEKRRRKSALQEAADAATGDKGPRSALEEASNVLRKRHKIRVAGAARILRRPSHQTRPRAQDARTARGGWVRDTHADPAAGDTHLTGRERVAGGGADGVGQDARFFTPDGHEASRQGRRRGWPTGAAAVAHEGARAAVVQDPQAAMPRDQLTQVRSGYLLTREPDFVCISRRTFTFAVRDWR